MKKIVILGIFLGAVGLVFFMNARKEIGPTVTPTPYTTDKSDGLSFVQSQNGLQLYKNRQYGFTVLIPDSFSQEVSEGNSPGTLKSVVFRENNLNTNEETNRDTPNGFNTSADNVLGFDIYPNSQKIDAQDIDKFRNWYEPAFNDGIETVNEIFVGGKSVLVAVVVNGVGGAKGRSYFIFSDQNIFGFSSNDVTKSVMEGIVGSFTQPAD